MFRENKELPVRELATANERMADAMERGIGLAPRQCRGVMFDDMGGACAVGTIALALGYAEKLGVTVYGLIRDVLGVDGPDGIISTVIALNDRTGWTREQIIEWLRR